MDSSQSDVNSNSVEQPSTPKSRMISKILSPAVRLWLRSQVEQVENLQLEIEAGDRQILSGCIPKITLSAVKAVYQGLHLSEIYLTGVNIRMNLGQVVKGKPLELLEPIPVSGRVLLRQEDLNASLMAPLLSNGVKEFLVALLKSGDLSEPSLSDPDLNLQNLQIILEENQVLVSAALISVSGAVSAIAIRTGFEVASPHELKLVNPQWLPHAQAKRGMAIEDLNGYTFSLGAETQIRRLTLAAGQVVCEARLWVIP
jgi:LmeA-like phospholipid-binding